jgi:hypothetical protein
MADPLPAGSGCVEARHSFLAAPLGVRAALSAGGGKAAAQQASRLPAYGVRRSLPETSGADRVLTLGRSGEDFACTGNNTEGNGIVT